MTFFPDHLIASRPDLAATFQSTLEDFLADRISYNAACSIVHGLGGTIAPLERLRAILNIGPTPIPTPDVDPNALRQPVRFWSSYEDQRLLCGISQFGLDNWTQISKFVGNGRTRSQCSQRWYRGLDPTISRGAWTAEEGDRLLALVAQMGTRSWTQVAACMENRSDVQCRYRYRSLKTDSQKVSGTCVADPPEREVPKHANGTRRMAEGRRRRLPPVSTLRALPFEREKRVNMANEAGTTAPDKTSGCESMPPFVRF
jgi:hypothetical protein